MAYFFRGNEKLCPPMGGSGLELELGGGLGGVARGHAGWLGGHSGRGLLDAVHRADRPSVCAVVRNAVGDVVRQSKVSNKSQPKFKGNRTKDKMGIYHHPFSVPTDNLQNITGF